MASALNFGKILAAFDGSEFSVRAVEAASALAVTGGSELVVIHVYSAPGIAYAGAPGIPVPSFPEYEEAMKEDAQKTLSRGVQVAVKAGARARGVLLEAPSAVQAIVEFAAAEKVGLIVSGTRGMGNFKRLVLGSVSSGLVGHAACSVLVVR
ncbi:MAG: universal stress protein [Thaumarchaeota archaeon]|nr:universal stress protein [Nitrososphaerota archaeon]